MAFQEPTRRQQVILVAVIGLLCLMDFIAIGLKVMMEIQAGHGLDYYLTLGGVRTNAYALLVVLAVVPFLLAFALWSNWHKWQENSD